MGATLDCIQRSYQHDLAMWHDVMRAFSVAWPCDIQKISCKTNFYLGELDKREKPELGQHASKLIPGPHVIIWKQHGHMTILVEVENIIQSVAQGQVADCTLEDPD